MARAAAAGLVCRTKSRINFAVMGKSMLFEVFMRPVAVSDRDCNQRLRPSGQTRASDRGTLAPARQVAVTFTGQCGNGRYRPSFDLAMPANRADIPSPQSTFRGLAPFRPAATHRAVKQQQTVATPTCVRRL